MSKCFILGAGASYGYDDTILSSDKPPLTNELFKKGFQLNMIKREKYPDLIDALQSYMKYHNEDSQEKQYETNVEEALSWFHNAFYESLNENRGVLQFLGAALVQGIYFIYELLRKYSVKYKQNGNNYQKLANLYREEKYSIISLNYDTIFETAILKSGLTYHHFPSRPHNGIPIAKIHGSINWIIQFSQVIGDDTIPKNKIIPTITKNILSNELLTNEPPLELPPQLSLYPLDKIAESGSNYWLPQIVPPIGEKKDSFFRIGKEEVWQFARSNLEEANEIVVIGSRIRLEDREFCALIQNNISKDATITVVSPDAEIIIPKIKSITKDEIKFSKSFHNFSEYTKAIS